jgi:hypothetical protein
MNKQVHAAQIENEAKLRKERMKIANNQCEDCHNKYLDWRGLGLVHLKNKGMGGTSHIYTIDEVRIKCAHCHNVNNHHLSEVID